MSKSLKEKETMFSKLLHHKRTSQTSHSPLSGDLQRSIDRRRSRSGKYKVHHDKFQLTVA